MSLKVKRSTLLAVGFGILPLRASEEEDYKDEERNAAFVEVIDVDVAAYLPPDDEESEGSTEAPNTIKDTFSRTYFEKTIGKTKECTVNCVKEMNDKSDNLVINLTCESGPNIGKYMIVNDIWVLIDKHWHDLYKEQGTDYLASKCFRAMDQAIKNPVRPLLQQNVA